jgi:hypothetical protein
MHPRPPRELTGLERELHRWVRNGLISEETAGAIWSFEHRASSRRPVGPPPPSSRVPVLAEVIGYMGAALAGAAGAVFLVRIWDDLALAGRLVIPGLGAAAFLGAGIAIARSDEPPIRRLAEFLWLLGAGATAWLAATVAADVADAPDRGTVLAVGCALSIVGLGLTAYRRWPVPQLILAVGLVWLLGGAFYDIELGFAIAWTLLGVAWMVLAMLRLLPPARATLLIGTLLALLGPMPALDEWTGIGLALGVVVAAGAVGIGAWQHHPQVLAIGAIGLFLYLVRSITYFLPGSGATALGLLAIGAGLIVVAVLAMRSRPRPGPPRPAHG